MSWLKSIAREVFGLFVDDGSFAIAILIWLAVAAGVMRWLVAADRWGGPVLFAGLAIVLVENILRFSRGSR
jgi:hypothetical protein